MSNEFMYAFQYPAVPADPTGMTLFYTADYDELAEGLGELFKGMADVIIELLNAIPEILDQALATLDTAFNALIAQVITIYQLANKAEISKEAQGVGEHVTKAAAQLPKIGASALSFMMFSVLPAVPPQSSPQDGDAYEMETIPGSTPINVSA